MNFKHIWALAFAGVLLLAIGLTAGLLLRGGGASSDPSRRELIERLVSTKAALESGLSFAALGGEEVRLRAAAELADRQLVESEKRIVADVIFAIHQTRAAWQMTFDGSCDRSGKTIYWGGSRYPNCTLQDIIKSIGIKTEDIQPGMLKASDHVISDLLHACLLLVQGAIDLLSESDPLGKNYISHTGGQCRLYKANGSVLPCPAGS